MPRQKPFTTDKQVKQLQARDRRYEVPDATLPGHYVVVQSSGRKAYIVRYRNARGRTRKLTVVASGRFGAVPLAAARKLARAAIQKVAEGADPAAVPPSGRTFGALAKRFVERHCKPNNRRWAEQARHLGIGPDLAPLPAGRVNYCKTWTSRPIESIKRRDVAELLDRVVDHNGRTQANRVLSTLAKLFSWYTTIDDDFVSPVTRGMARGTTVKRTRILTDAEMCAIWPLLDRPEFRDVFGAVLKLAFLLGQRRSEISNMEWVDINEAAAGGPVWVIPGIKYKTGLDHPVPLSPAAWEIINAQPRRADTPLVFATFRGKLFNTWDMRKRQLDALARVPAWRIHDARRTSRTWMSRAGVRSEIAERCIGHSVRGVEGIYDQHQFIEERRRAFIAVSELLQRILNPPPQNVVELRPATQS